MIVGAALLALACFVALFAGDRTASYMPELNLQTPAISLRAPVIGPAPHRLSRRVVLVLIDGLRLDTSYGRPFLDHLREIGIDGQARSHFPSLSRPNYVSIVTGVEPRWSGVRGNDYDWQVHLDSVMARARAAGMRVAYAAAESKGLPQMFPEDLDEGGLSPWPGGVERTVAHALSPGGDDLLLVWMSDVDNAGHKYGAASPAYRTAARHVDEKLGAMFGQLDLTKDTIVVVADHGHIDGGGHGGVEPEVMQVPLVLAGAGVKRGAIIEDARLVDVSPTIATLLGLPPPGHALGRVLTEALDLDDDTRASIATADAARIAQIMPTLRDEQYLAKIHAWEVRAERGGLLVAVLALLVALAGLARRRGWVFIDRRVALIALPAFPLTFYGMLMAFENWLSPSMLPGTGNATRKLFVYGAIAAGANLIAAWYALSPRVVPRDRLAAAAGHVFVGLVVAIAPAGLAWTIAGPTVAVDLPGPTALMWPPVTYAATACFAASAALTMVVEYGVFLARASDPRRLRRRRSRRTLTQPDPA